MRSLAWLLLPALALCPRLAMPADEPQEQPPTQFSTKVQGTVPDLTGRWLAVGYVSVQGQGESVPISVGWDVTTTSDGKPNLVVRWGGLPPDVKKSFDAAAAQRVAWTPSDQELQQLRDAWDTVTLDRPPVATVETTISGPDDPSDLVKAEPTMKDSLFNVATVVNFAPGPQRPTKDVMVFGAKERLGDGYGGAYAHVTIANAPFPVPVAFKGTFRLYRLGEAPRKSWWRRFLDVFAGCGRNPSS